MSSKTDLCKTQEAPVAHYWKTTITKAMREVMRVFGFNGTTRKEIFAKVTTTAGGNPRKILGKATKTQKGEKKKVLTAVLYLSPHMESGWNLCAWATLGCILACLGHSSGHLRFNSSKQARIAKSIWLKLFPGDFLATLADEIAKHERRAIKKGFVPAVRLNGSSDILWERLGIMDMFPGVMFYDYTKAPAKNRDLTTQNYHLTFSHSEDPRAHDRGREYLDNGHNVAVVVGDADGTLPGAQKVARQLVDRGSLWGRETVDGDETDVRFRDGSGKYVVLYTKGAAIHDRSGFAVRSPGIETRKAA